MSGGSYVQVRRGFSGNECYFALIAKTPAFAQVAPAFRHAENASVNTKVLDKPYPVLSLYSALAMRPRAAWTYRSASSTTPESTSRHSPGGLRSPSSVSSTVLPDPRGPLIRMSIASGARELGIDRTNLKKDLGKLTEQGCMTKRSNGPRTPFSYSVNVLLCLTVAAANGYEEPWEEAQDDDR